MQFLCSFHIMFSRVFMPSEAISQRVLLPNDVLWYSRCQNQVPAVRSLRIYCDFGAYCTYFQSPELWISNVQRNRFMWRALDVAQLLIALTAWSGVLVVNLLFLPPGEYSLEAGSLGFRGGVGVGVGADQSLASEGDKHQITPEPQ